MFGEVCKNKNINPELHGLVKQFMVHGPCIGFNENAPCIDKKKHKCEKQYPMPLVECTETTESGYIYYRRRNIKLNNDNEDSPLLLQKVNVPGKKSEEGVTIGNSWVVPFNPLLLLRYKCHLNIEIVHSGIKLIVHKIFGYF